MSGPKPFHVLVASARQKRKRQATQKIFQFSEEWDSKDSLTIYVYSDHSALVERGGNKEYLIAGRADEYGLVEPKFDWIAASLNLRHTGGDVLYIFDSYYDGQLPIGAGPEILAAAQWSSGAGSALNISFVTILAAELEILNGKPCSVFQLFGRILRKILEDDNIISDPPIHVFHPNRNSTVLQRLENPAGVRKTKRIEN
ncbi:MAG: hypothetical protein M1818_000587 [Claussenomyces sp. TS43310]|nr:MAG: hypothetical protein M1818_000587 [Claussenomyces sp. TS43310]